MILEKTGRTSHTLILARASAIPVLSGLPLDAIRPLCRATRGTGMPDVASWPLIQTRRFRGYYAIAQKLADMNAQRRQALDAAQPVAFNQR